MGKSTTAQMFAKAGVPVYDADAVVHMLYAGKAAPAIEAEFPGTTANGTVDRTKLSPHVVGRPEAMKKLESIIHPLVREEEELFLKSNLLRHSSAVVLDVPLLFETSGERRVNVCVVVTAAPDIQRMRVLARPGMTVGRFSAILEQQMPDEDKRRKAHFIIDTSFGLQSARRAVDGVLKAVCAMA